ncbi:hypothetical protein C7212DRAFT_342503 [Tuber magnatum]|uniref:Secreted RxLR effector peptide protein n=1 Tax=Tuber magnatum TaxID=42249 RepID=A0A317SVP1_9PEZI|nr:hypothetical protein C7212DRAFT_342503 [Tuber magnatum]
MRLAAIFLPFALLLVGSHSAPIWGPGISTSDDFSPENSTPRRLERPVDIEELAEKEYRDQKLAEFNDKPKQSAWKKIWKGIRDLFSFGTASKDKNTGAGARTTFGTDGASMEVTESLFEFTENDTGSWHTTEEDEDIDTASRYTAQENIDSKWNSVFGKSSPKEEN